MTRKIWLRLMGAIAAVSVVSLSLTGCLPVVGNAATQALAKAEFARTGQPAAGECWKSSYKNATTYADWGSADPVPCTGAHQLDTYAIGKVSKSFTGHEFGADGRLASSIAHAEDKLCDAARGNLLPGVIDDQSSRYILTQWAPSEVQWKAGARWLRCDIGLIAFGSPVRKPALEDLPSFASVVSNAVTHSSRYAFCADETKGSTGGPYSKDAVFADCTGTPQWTETRDHQADSPDGSYPGRTYLVAHYAASCKNDLPNVTHTTYVYYPSKSQWDAGDHLVECWVSET